MCEKHPRGIYNQLKWAGIADSDIPLEYLGVPMKEDDDVPF